MRHDKVNTPKGWLLMPYERSLQAIYVNPDTGAVSQECKWWFYIGAPVITADLQKSYVQSATRIGGWWTPIFRKLILYDKIYQFRLETVPLYQFGTFSELQQYLIQKTATKWHNIIEECKTFDDIVCSVKGHR